MKITEINKKIKRVFESLALKGIIGKENYWCCQSCGCGAITDYENEFKGYVFYHNQDYKDLKKNGYCYLAFGSFENKEGEAEKTGQEIAQAFKEAGVKVEWDGKRENRIKIDFNEVKIK